AYDRHQVGTGHAGEAAESERARVGGLRHPAGIPRHHQRRNDLAALGPVRGAPRTRQREMEGGGRSVRTNLGNQSRHLLRPAMNTSASLQALPAPWLWTGRVLSGFVVLFLLFSGVIKLIGRPEVAQTFTELGYPTKFAITIGIIEIVCIVLYA